MDEKHKDCIKDVIEQNEEIKDNVERLEKLKKVDKRRNIILVIEFCIFLMIILYSCSASLNQNTVVQPNDSHIVAEADSSSPYGVPTSDETTDDTPDDEQKDGLYTITIDKINIAVNESYSMKTSDLYQKLESEAAGVEYTRPEVKEMIKDFNSQTNEYSIKSVENVVSEKYEKAGNKVTVDTAETNDGVHMEDGHLMVCFVADESQVPVEDAYGDNTLGYLMWKVSDTVEIENTDNTCVVFIFDADTVDSDGIAQAIVDTLNESKVPIGAHHVDYEYIDKYQGFLDAYFFGEDLKPVVESVADMTSDLYIAKSWGMASANSYYMKATDEESRGVGLKPDDCILVADDETPNIYAVVVNIDGYSSSAEFYAPNQYELDVCISIAESEGYHK